MEQVDQPQPPPTEEQVQPHHQNNNDDHYADSSSTQPLIHTTKPLTASNSYFPQPQPQPPELDFPMIYSGFFFNSNSQNSHHHHQPYPEADGVVGTATTSTYMAVAPGLFKSCSDGSEAATAFNYMSNNCSSRWPREETMSLLQIRSRLHSSFKQATHKGPLWDEVSRIMYEEHGYQRSGKKCREKFENLYKYYKKTKEAKSGKHDGKNYRFFRQLEALYGDQIEVDHLAGQPTTISSQTQLPPNSNNQVIMVRSGNGDQEVSPSPDSKMKLPCDQSCLSACPTTTHHRTSHPPTTHHRTSHPPRLRQQAEERLEKKHKLWDNKRA